MKKICLALVLVLMIAVPGWATDWYVRPAGGNYGAEDGTSYENAWDGFSNIAWSNLQPGDTLYLDGTFSSRLTINCAGTASAYITITSYSQQSPAIITVTTNKGIILRTDYTSNGDYVILSNIIVKGCGATGMEVGGFDHIILDSMKFISNTGYGLNVNVDTNGGYANDLTIRNCEFISNTQQGIWGNIGDYCLVENCIFYQNGDNNSSLSTGAANGHLVFRNCICDGAADVGMGIAFNSSTGCLVDIERCIITNSTTNGILVHGSYSGTVKIKYCLVKNNNTYGIASGVDNLLSLEIADCTVIDNGSIGIYLQDGTETKIYNCLVDGNGETTPTSGIQVAWHDSGVTFDSDYNLISPQSNNRTVYDRATSTMYATVAAWSSATGYDTHSLDSDPLLTSTYHLTHNSPCIDAGTKVTGIHDQDDWKDLDGHVIHYGSNPDIGCYEYNTNFIKRWGRAKWNIGRWGRGKWGGARW